jgi:hypothetical protein
MNIENDDEINETITKARREIEKAGGQVTKIFVSADRGGQAGVLIYAATWAEVEAVLGRLMPDQKHKLIEEAYARGVADGREEMRTAIKSTINCIRLLPAGMMKAKEAA